MIPTPEGRRPAMTPQLAVRVTVVGSFALMMFAVIFFRLWFLQVLDSQAYTKQANSNRVRDIYVPAERGEIVDRDGNVLVDSIPTVDVQISLPDLPVPASNLNIEHPPKADVVVYRRLAGTLNMSMARQRCRFPNPYDPKRDVTVRLSPIACDVAKQQMTLPFQDVLVQPDVSRDVQFYLAERQNLYPGVEAQEVYRRHYPDGTLAAQLFGTIGRINAGETRQKHFKGVNQNAIVGQSGLEYEYDRYLRGTPGEQKVAVNALGEFQGDLPGVNPVQGDTLKLSIDTALQRVGEQSLATSIGQNGGAGGSFVAMDPDNGQVYAMGSNPSFNPTDFTHTMSNAYYASHYRDASSGDPLDNRAIDFAGQIGSTFKVITATAALESGVWSAGETYDDTGQYCFANSTLCLHNSGHAANGVVDLVSAIKLSDDVFFYHLGALLNFDPATHPNGGALQQWARAYGLGENPDIDLPNAANGQVPSPNLLNALYKEELQCESATGPFKGKPKHPASQGGCGISNAQARYWTVGDDVNTAVGQGDDQVTPLQLAIVYSALANGGTVVRPHIGMQVDSPDGTVVQNIDAPAKRHLHIDPLYLQTILEGLREAASAPGGTSADVMGSFPEPVYAKTGTAEYINASGVEQDYAWYACFVPRTATSKPIAVVVSVEKGGFGDVAAAPVARQILSQWFFGKPGQYKSGTSTTL